MTDDVSSRGGSALSEGLGLVELLREAAPQAGHYGAWSGGVLLEQAADEIERLRNLYEELLFAVAKKYPGETRHQTALRYIKAPEWARNKPVCTFPLCVCQRYPSEPCGMGFTAQAVEPNVI